MTCAVTWLSLASWVQAPRAPGIYVIRRRETGQEYVGKSTSLRTRLRVHSRAASAQRLHRAIRKHGLDAFDFMWDLRSADDLQDTEIAWIAERRTYGDAGYNDTRGGDGGMLGFRHSEDSLEKMRARIGKATSGHTGKQHSPEARAQISAAARGKMRRPEIRAAIQQQQIARVVAGLADSFIYSALRPVLVWPPESMLPLEFPSVGAAAAWAGVSKTSISNWLLRQPKNRHNRAGGCAWADTSML